MVILILLSTSDNSVDIKTTDDSADLLARSASRPINTLQQRTITEIKVYNSVGVLQKIQKVNALKNTGLI